MNVGDRVMIARGEPPYFYAGDCGEIVEMFPQYGNTCFVRFDKNSKADLTKSNSAWRDASTDFGVWLVGCSYLAPLTEDREPDEITTLDGFIFTGVVQKEEWRPDEAKADTMEITRGMFE